MPEPIVNYTEDNVQTLTWQEHVRLRPGVYIGKVGDGSAPDDGLYILIKEVIDNAVDEFAMGCGKVVQMGITDNVDNQTQEVFIRDFGRGIPLGSLIDCASKMNTGAKYDNESFQKSVGLNGMGLKLVNAVSEDFYIEAYRDGECGFGHFSRGQLLEEGHHPTQEKNGTYVRFTPDKEIFSNYRIVNTFVEQMLRNYAYLNVGLKLQCNGVDFISKNGLLDYLNDNLSDTPLYPPIHLKGQDIEMVICHTAESGENFASFANGQNTSQGGTHLSAFREALSRTIKDFFKKDFDPSDVRQAMAGAISIRLMEPVFSNQTKTELDSKEIRQGGPSLRNFIGEFIKTNLDNYLHKNPATADIMLKRILLSEKERKEVASARKTMRESAKKTSLHNDKLRDCRVHRNDKHALAGETMIFITEGDSASGSITKSRNPMYQAVFSLRGKPLNTYGKTKRVIYENMEFNYLQAALDIEVDLDNLRYSKVVIATDADSDGMHIRLLMVSFFLNYFPELIRQNHLYILQTPLFRVRNKKETIYCYSDKEREQAIKKLGPNPEITRFKGLGEISANEFKDFINENIRLDLVRIDKDDRIADILEFYMGGNTKFRRNFIIENLRNVEI